MTSDGIIPTAFKKLKDSYITTVYDCGDLDRLQQEIVAEIEKMSVLHYHCQDHVSKKELLGTESEAKGK